jgi:hypothetical protein
MIPFLKVEDISVDVTYELILSIYYDKDCIKQ